jgi:CubicO group peptidase (beta-lactamase class C family)
MNRNRTPQILTGLALLATFIAACGGSAAPTGLRNVDPASVGWSSDGLAGAASVADEIGSAAVLAMHDRDVFFSYGDTDAKLPIHSIRKPLLGALYGIHVEAGDIDLDATLEELDIDDTPPTLTADEKQATVRDLLKARSGVYHPAHGEVQEMIYLRPERGSHPPDTYFYYNNWDFNVLGTIFEQETGLSVCEAFRVEIAEVIGMEDFERGDCRNVYDFDRSIHPVYQFQMTARDMARFGLLYLREGRWGDQQIVPEWWIDESWTQYSIDDPDVGLGYGYLWGVAAADGNLGRTIGHEMYFHGGLGIHILAVIPDQDLVVVHRMDTTVPFTDPGDKLGELMTRVILAGA